MAKAAQPSRGDELTPAGSVSAGETNGGRSLRGSLRAAAHVNNSAFRWVAIIVVSIVLWVVGADWRTLVMVAAAAAMFAMAIDQIENVSDR
jgi:hypothetical protein